MSVSTFTTEASSRRVPRHDRGLLSDPPLTHASRLATETRHLASSSDIRIAGTTLADWRADAATETLAAADEYAARSGRVLPTHNANGPLIVGGHQPTLFHCGVLIKNFALARLARQAHGTPLNLIIDNDVATPLHLVVPDGSRERPATRLVPFSSDNAARPWEDIKPELSGAFTGFPDRIAEALSRWDIDPLLPGVWPAAISAAEQGRGMAECISAARIALQDELDHGTLELPISCLATLPPFLRFLAMVLLEADRFAEAHNRALSAYRRANRVRSRTHPAPNLARHDTWLETPFWCWQPGDTHRRRLMTRVTPTGIAISDGGTLECEWAIDADSGLEHIASKLGTLQNAGLRIRPSAISTTLFVRSFLADLFVHGIGGSKYDEVTDALMADFFGIAPPPYLTLSATLHLPLGGLFEASLADRNQLVSRRRRMIYNAQDFISEGQAVDLRNHKSSLIDQQHADQLDTSDSSRERRRERYRAFQDVDRELSRHTIGARQALEGKLQQLDRQLDANAVLTNREFSFCLFPARLLQRFFDESLSDLD